MPLHRTLTELFNARLAYKGNKLSVVPTMGALHNGHLALIRKAVRESEVVWVTIFVNPIQFDSEHDLNKYPKNLDEDIKLIKAINLNIHVFAPSVKEMYSDVVESKKYMLGGLDNLMEGAFRPGHFNGVITIVSKLFKALKPNYAYFGEKDFQQLKIIRFWVNKNNIKTKIIGCPIEREENGLAMSSRNERLKKETRNNAGFIYSLLLECSNNSDSVIEIYNKIDLAFSLHTFFKLEYAICVDEDTLQEISIINPKRNQRIFVAITVDGVRLIDNIALK
jgi:pantoate--beta-alanine ligase